MEWERGIPLSTADNYIARHETALALAEGKLPTKDLPPTAAEITQKVKKLAPGLIGFLSTPEFVTQ